MIFESKIHRTEVNTVSTTPPQPKSKDQDVVKTLACRRFSTPLPPKGFTTPSTVPSGSTSSLGLLCTLLKWMIVSVKRENDAEMNSKNQIGNVFYCYRKY